MNAKQKILLTAVGVVTGIVNGFFGGGGGMIVVPMLTMILGLEQKVSHATALAVILPVTVVSTVAYFLRGAVLAPTLTIIIVAVSVTVGGIIGALLLKKVSGKALGKIFAVLMLIAGVKMIVG